MDSPITEELLQELLQSGILSKEDIVAKKRQMNIKKVMGIHPYSIAQRKDGRFITKVLCNNQKKQITGTTKNELYQKLFDFYFPVVAPSLREVYENWMVYRRDFSAVKPKTLQEATNEWKKFYANTELADTPINKIKPVQIIRFFRNVTKNREYSQKRISNAKSILNGIMMYAVEEELIEHNPVLEVNFKQFTYKPVENQNDVFSVDDVVKLLSHLEYIMEPYALAIRLDFNLLIRIGELKALRWDDIDISANTIYVHQQCLIEREMMDNLTFKPRTTLITDHMKGYTSHGYRKQPLTPEALKILQQAKQLNPCGQYIFMPDERLMTTDSFNRRLKKYCKEAGVPYHSSHKIRFYTASTAFDGSNLATVSRLMGHSNTETTMHYLRDVLKGEDAIETISRLGLESAIKTTT